jgi:hypothetical protein
MVSSRAAYYVKLVARQTRARELSSDVKSAIGRRDLAIAAVGRQVPRGFGGADHPTKYDGLLPSEMRRLKQLEEENKKQRCVVADLSLDKEMLQDAMRRKL